jgi:regulator of RNase E activity RraA
MIVADAEGIVVIPKSNKQDVFTAALQKAEAEARMTFDEWKLNHRKKVEDALNLAKN